MYSETFTPVSIISHSWDVLGSVISQYVNKASNIRYIECVIDYSVYMCFDFIIVYHLTKSS